MSPPNGSSGRLQSGASLTERAYAEIRHRVMTLAYKPGEFLNETRICTELGLGRTPVHEALHRLQVEGLVQIVPRKGVMIRTDSLNDVIALIETRMVVEPAGIALAAQRAQSHHVRALQTLLKQAKQAIKDGDRAGYMALDSKFHNEIVSATENSVLADVMRMLHQRASRIWQLQLWTDADLQLTQTEHEAIFDALKCGDPEAAASAARAHLTSLRRRIMHGVL
ncbi:GntR family transcriptional regulator [Rhodoplanes sp. Z2-YC6860]|uniref:GntR family transcriptional regulator n=1 Tax=Rhodoplanes sp. Z2-YC6860 TaxID=674703 RepID=UPI0018DE5066|nr:GntR family transcriptional regulator [Rhodoplanes sp. Z2-YC6860]